MKRSLLLLFLWLFFAGCFAANGVCGADGPKKTVRFGFLVPMEAYGSHNYQPGEADVRRPLVAYLERTLPDIDFQSFEYTITDLPAAVKRRELDYALISSGQYIELQASDAAYALCSLFTARFPDPNRFTAALFVTTSDHTDITSVADMEGKRGVFNNRVNFINYQLPMAEIAQLGFNPEKFFAKELFTNDHPQEVLRLLLEGKADVGFFRVCEYETLMKTRPELRGRFKPVGLKEGGNQACMRSTELFPGWTIAMTSPMDPSVTKRITQALLAMPTDDVSGMGWSIATEFDRVHEIFRLVRLGPYEHLRAWTVSRIWSAYWPFILLALSLLVAWVLHWLSVEKLAASRARALSEAREKQHAIEDKAIRTEERLTALSKLGVVNQLSSIFAHEMGQPLSAIRYRARAVRTMLRNPDGKAERIEESLRAIEEQSERATEILQKVRSYAKGQTSRRSLIRLDLLLENTIADLKRSGKIHASLTIRTEPLTVRGDELEVGLALLNMLKNAAEAANAPENFIRATLKKDRSAAVFLLENSGEALTRERIAEFMAPMGSHKEKGIGLGLIIISSIAEAHGGSFTLEPRAKGGGAVARLSLPLCEKNEEGEADG